ncbi:MAG: hypothetical protein ACR2IE_03330 [Candidatus Sumerlaeaceae bacterium]
MPDLKRHQAVLLAIVPTPMTAAGSVSAGDLEKYVNWMRGSEVDGVLIWSAVGGGQCLDTTELEELYTVWRAALLPHQQVWVQVPAGGMQQELELLRFQTVHARELGADGIMSDGLCVPHLKDVAGQTPLLALDLHISKRPKANDFRVSASAALQLPVEQDTRLEALDDDQLAVLMLAALQNNGVISAAGGFSPRSRTLRSPGNETLRAILDLLPR